MQQIREAIRAHPANVSYTERGIAPLFTASRRSKLVIIGQAPGSRAEASGIPWDDKSGETLREWLGVSDEQFYDPDVISLLPMDFYFPGKGKTGDLPPRKDFAPLWHPQLLAEMPNIGLRILIGAYAQAHYLGDRQERNLTETVRSATSYLPDFFPIVHPSPLNFRWQKKNPWFAEEVLPRMRSLVAEVIDR
ncbi:MAG: uracil-DNA glycosylase family protein [Actinomycetota bacterium]